MKFKSNVNRFIGKIANHGNAGTAPIRETLTVLSEKVGENRLWDINEKMTGTNRWICPAGNDTGKKKDPFTLKGPSEIFHTLVDVKDKMLEADPNLERNMTIYQA